MTTLVDLKDDIEARLFDAVPTKMHVSVRWEPGPGICRVGVCLHDFTWENRELAIKALVDFEDAHHGDIAVDFDIIPLDSVNTVGFAEV